MCFKNFEGKSERESLKRTISVSGRLALGHGFLNIYELFYATDMNFLRFSQLVLDLNLMRRRI